MAHYARTTLSIATETKGSFADDEYGRIGSLTFSKVHPGQAGEGWMIIRGSFPERSPHMAFTDDDARKLRDWLLAEFPLLPA